LPQRAGPSETVACRLITQRPTDHGQQDAHREKRGTGCGLRDWPLQGDHHQRIVSIRDATSTHRPTFAGALPQPGGINDTAGYASVWSISVHTEEIDRSEIRRAEHMEAHAGKPVLIKGPQCGFNSHRGHSADRTNDRGDSCVIWSRFETLGPAHTFKTVHPGPDQIADLAPDVFRATGTTSVCRAVCLALGGGHAFAGSQVVEVTHGS
jgi:hypothetical protein